MSAQVVEHPRVQLTRARIIVSGAREQIWDGRRFDVDEATILDACEHLMAVGSPEECLLASAVRSIITDRTVNQINRRGRQIADAKSALTLALVTYALASLVVGALEQLF